MGIIDVANYYVNLKQMEELISQVKDEELQQKLNVNFRWLIENQNCWTTKQTAIEVM